LYEEAALLTPPDGTKGLSLFLIPKFLVGPAGNFQQRAGNLQGILLMSMIGHGKGTR
jgi:hypothetical protein